MKFTLTKIAIVASFIAATSSHAFAASSHASVTKNTPNEKLKLIAKSLNSSDSELVETEIEKINDNEFDVNGLKIELSELEEHKAKNWKLTNEQYARYKYIMLATPRGNFTPNLDPITVLGNEARTEMERKHFARLAMNLEQKRVNGELMFQIAANDYGEEMAKALGRKDKEDEKENKNLISLFIDASDCEVSSACRKFLTDMIGGQSKSSSMVIYYKNGLQNLRGAIKGIGFNEERLKEKDIKIVPDTGEHVRYGKGRKPPFAIINNKEGNRYVMP